MSTVFIYFHPNLFSTLSLLALGYTLRLIMGMTVSYLRPRRRIGIFSIGKLKELLCHFLKSLCTTPRFKALVGEYLSVGELIFAQFISYSRSIPVIMHLGTAVYSTRRLDR